MATSPASSVAPSSQAKMVMRRMAAAMLRETPERDQRCGRDRQPGSSARESGRRAVGRRLGRVEGRVLRTGGGVAGKGDEMMGDESDMDEILDTAGAEQRQRH